MRKIIEGDVNLCNLYLKELFDLSDVEVVGNFNCSKNDLTSLVGSPHTVGGFFSCRNNNITSLKGAPHTVGGRFDCMHNHLTSLEGIPKSIGYGTGFFKDFKISEKLKDKFPEEYIRSLCEIKGEVIYV